MAVLVTRPHPDDETTADALRAQGFEVLLRADAAVRAGRRSRTTTNARYGAVIVTSANALRAIAPHLAGQPAARSCRCSRWANIPPPPRATPGLAR